MNIINKHKLYLIHVFKQMGINDKSRKSIIGVEYLKISGMGFCDYFT